MHFLQSQYWRDIKEKLGNKTYDAGKVWFQTTKIPGLNKFIGYVPRPMLADIDWELLYEEGKKVGCVYISVDPLDLKQEAGVKSQEIKNEEKVEGVGNQLPVSSYQLPITNYKEPQTTNYELRTGVPTHLKENVIIDISKSEDELLMNMKQKHRYNLKLAQKKGVQVKISDNEEMFEEFLKLYEETAKRQKYFGRSKKYLRTVWESLKEEAGDRRQETGVKNEGEVEGVENQLPVTSYQLPTTNYKEPQTANYKPLTSIATAYYEDKPLSSWMLFLYEDTIYYPYGGSSDEHKNVMATYALVWELIKWGKERGYKYLDLWGIESETRNEKRETSSSEETRNSQLESYSPYDGFSRFKLGFGGEHIVYKDTIDLIIDRPLYLMLKKAYSLRETFKFFKWL